MKNPKILFLAFILLFAGCAGGPSVKKEEIPAPKPAQLQEETTEVEADGFTAIIPDAILATKEQSLMAAQRAALEKAVGVWISAQTIVSQAQVLDENIFSRTGGYIKSWDIIFQGEESGLYKTRIKAKIKLGSVKKDLDTLGLLIKSKKVGNPRVMVLISTKGDVGADTSTEFAETTIMGVLLDKGYKLVDKEQLDVIKGEEQLKSALAGNEADAAILGKKFDADVVILGSISSQQIKNEFIEKQGMVSYRTNLAVKVVRSATAQVFLTSDKSQAQPDIMKEASITNGVKKVAKAVAEDIAPKIAEKLYEGTTIQIKLTKVKDLNSLDGIQKAMKGIEGIEGMILRTFEGSEAVIEMELKYWNTQTLAPRLENLKGLNLAVKELTAASITLEVK